MNPPTKSATVAASVSAALILVAAVIHNFKTSAATISWQPTPGDAYKLYYGKAPGSYTATLDPGISGNYNFMVVRGTTYYLALSAIRQGTETPKSLEYKYTAPK